MTASFNHTIVAAKDKAASAAFYCDLLELKEAPSWGVFTNLQFGDGFLLQFVEEPNDFTAQHYAFLVDDAHFDRAYAKIQAEKREHWADPQTTRPGEINHGHGGRGFYFLDPSGHYLELITRPYL